MHTNMQTHTHTIFPMNECDAKMFDVYISMSFVHFKSFKSN